jgi:pimeloyl-ACP methyl ester carboxylesterase
VTGVPISGNINLIFRRNPLERGGDLMSIGKKFFRIIGVLFIVVVSYLLVVIFAPGFHVPPQPIPRRKKKKYPLLQSREDVSFLVDGMTVRGWLYKPQSAGPVPCIVLSTGLGGTKDAILENYALRFVAAGWAALTYDYRHFGDSEGQPRQLVDVNGQLDDLRSAVAYVRGRPEINPEKIVLWGTSAGGGYGIVVAAEDPRIAGVITQCAALDSDADARLFFERTGITTFIKLFMHAQRDKGRSRFGLSPHHIPVVGRPGTLAFLNAPGAFDGYARVVAESETFENYLCARLLLMTDGLDVVEAAANVRCPGLFVVCAHDNLVSAESHVRAAAALGEKAAVISYPIGHFDIYEGEYFEKAVGEMGKFLARLA